MRIVSVQPRDKLLFREVGREFLPLAREDGLACWVYNSLAGGLLTGNHDFAGWPTPDGALHGARTVQRYLDRYWHDEHFTAVRVVADLSAESSRPLPATALAWVLCNAAATSAIVALAVRATA